LTTTFLICVEFEQRLSGENESWRIPGGFGIRRTFSAQNAISQCVTFGSR